MIVPDTKENLDKCICSNCSSYNRCMKENQEGLFCGRGSTKCEIEEQDCICNTCPVDQEYNLTGRLDLMEKTILKMNQFYCARGSADSRK